MFTKIKTIILYKQHTSRRAKMDLKTYMNNLKNTIDAVSETQSDNFQNVIDTFKYAQENGKNIYLFGNGGSGATASHFASDMNKGASGGSDKRFRAICLNDNVALMLAISNDMSYEDVFVEQLKNFLEEGDVVLGISGSGNSKNVIKAIEYAKSNGAKTIGFCGYDGGKLKQIVDTSLHVPLNDMQISEDLHIIFVHALMRCLNPDYEC